MAKEALILQAHRGAALAVAFSPDEQVLFTGGTDKLLHVWDMGTLQKGDSGTPAATWKGHTAPVAVLAYDAAGGRLASGAAGEVRVWDPARGKLLHQLSGESRIAFGPAGHHLATLASASRVEEPRVPGGPAPGARITLYDARDFSILKHVDPVDRRHTALSFAPNGSLLFVGGSGAIHRISLPDGTSEGTQKGHQIAVSHIRPSPNEAVFASTGMDGTLYFWTVVGGDEIHSIALGVPAGPGGFPLSFGPDGRLVAVGCGSSVRLYRAPESSLRKEFALPSELHDVTVSPTGRWVANALADGSVHVIELRS